MFNPLRRFPATVRRSRLALLGSALLVLGLIAAILSPAVAVNAAPNPPRLSSFVTELRRGAWTTIYGGGYQPNASYTLSSDGGTFFDGANQFGASAPITADDNGAFSIDFMMAGGFGGTSATLTLIATADSAAVGHLAFAVTAPQFIIEPRDVTGGSKTCPGGTLIFFGDGFLDGDYQVTVNDGTSVVLSGRAVSGALRVSSTLRLPAAIPGPVQVTVTDRGGQVVSTATTGFSGPAMTEYVDGGKVQIDGDCFAPKEKVTVNPPPGATAPAAVLANPAGQLHLSYQLHPLAQPRVTGVGTFDGQASHQHAGSSNFPYPASITIEGTTLLAGQSLSDLPNSTDPIGILSARSDPGYVLEQINGYLYLTQQDSNSSYTLWFYNSSNHVPGNLTLQTDGNLVLRAGGTDVVWSTGTRGTGTANRLVMQDDGNPTLRNAAGQLLWSVNTGLVRNAGGLVTYAYLATARAGHAVYVNGLIKQKDSAGQLVRAAHRVVYLERYLGGEWLTVLGRTTDVNGQISVGFIQPGAVQYRLVVPQTSTAGGAASAASLR